MAALQCPKHRQHLDSFCTICGSILAINKEKKMVILQQERLALDKELLKAEKRNHKRALKVQASSGLSASEQDDLRKRAAKLEGDLTSQQMQHLKEVAAFNTRLKQATEQHQMKELEVTLKLSRQEEQLVVSQKAFDKEKEVLSAKVDILELERKRMEQELETARATPTQNHVEDKVEFLELKKEIELLRKAAEEKELLARTRSADLSQNLATQTKELESRQVDLEDMRDDLADMVAERDNYQAQLQQLQERVKTLREQQQQQTNRSMDGGSNIENAEACANCEDLEEEIYDMKLKLNKRQVEHQKEMKAFKEELEQANQGNIQVAGAAAKTFVTASELQELRRIEVEKKKVVDKFLALEALQKTTEKEHEVSKQEVADLRADNYQLALELEQLHKQTPDQEELLELKIQMDTLQMNHDAFIKNRRMDDRDFVDLVDLLDKKQQQVFDRDLPVMTTRVGEIETKLTEIEQIKLDERKRQETPQPPKQASGEIVGSPAAATGSRRERNPPLTKMDADQNRHVTEFYFKGDKQSGKYTGFLSSPGDLPQGHGILRVDNGDVYEGEWKDGQRDGDHGVYTWYDGDLYTGPWCQGRRHGHGVFVFSDGRLYDGFYKMGQRCGKGMFVWPYGAKYEGSYKNDKRNGAGEYVYADGRVYRGEYKDDRPHGYGVEMAKDGTVIYDGNWVYGEFVGDGTGSVVGSIVG